MIIAALKARLQDAGLFYDRKFDCASADDSPYKAKLGYDSPHSYALRARPPGSRVLDIGCAGGYMAAALAGQKHCIVDGIDAFVAVEPGCMRFICTISTPACRSSNFEQYDFVLMLDVIEHLAKPEIFLGPAAAAR